MKLLKSLILSATLAVILCIPGAASSDSRVEFEATVNEIAMSYGLDPVQVTFGRLGIDHLALMRCRISTGHCEIIVDNCVTRLRASMKYSVAVHEAAHYVNARINGLYDHGPEWQAIVEDIGAEVYVGWPEDIVRQCG